MKKQITLFFSLAACLSWQQANAQATQSGGGTTGHQPPAGFTPATHYVGWDNNTGIDLQIRHDASRPITFHTGPAGGGTTPERMRITPTNGFVGIGLTAPQNKLHLDVMDTSNPVYSQWTTLLTYMGAIPQAPQASDGLRIGVTPVGVTNAPNGLLPFAEINQQEDAPINFFTNNTEQMRIMGRTNYFGTNANEGFAGLGLI